VNYTCRKVFAESIFAEKEVDIHLVNVRFDLQQANAFVSSLSDF
jgi:hypothetical protein